MKNSLPILVTGGAGYIGSHACKALARAGYAPMVLDDLSSGHEWAVKWGPLVRGDIHDTALLDDLFARHRFAGVLHFAAFIQVGESVAEPAKYYENNTGGALRLLDAARRHGCRAVVFSSTAAVYGTPDSVPIPVSAPLRPENPYGRSKRMVEEILADFEAAYGLRHAILRYFNAAGADLEGEIGEEHAPETHLVPLAVLAALGKAPPLRLFGDDWDTPDGTPIRDYIHVTDLAEAHVLALRRILERDESLVCNLGTGQGNSVREIVAAVARVGGREVPHSVAPRRPGDPSRLVADPSAAEELLGWRPRITEIEEIVASAWRWHAQRTGI